MPKITSVEVQKNNPHIFNIFLDDVFAFGADEDLVVEYRLIAGKQVEKSEIEKLLFESGAGKLMGSIYRLWNVRQRSEKEVRDYFKVKNFHYKIKGKELISNQLMELVIKKLKQKNLLNDAEFAKVWVEARRNSKQKGIRALKAELYQKGIDKDIIENVVSEQNTSYSEEQLAEKFLKKKWRVWQQLPYLEKKKKAYGFLTRQGFEYEVVKDVIEKFTQKG